MPQETNLNRTPYFDDFDANKDFHKVLFRPGYSVQARELTTLQSILQNQIEKFGNHFFKEGSRVIPGNITFTLKYENVQIEPDFLGLPVNLYLDKLIGVKIQGSISGVVAGITNTAINEDTGNIILYINYESAGTDFGVVKFVDGENLVTLSNITFGISNIISSGQNFAKTINSGSTSTGSAAFIGEGVYFIRGYFVRVPSQTLVLDNFSSSPTYRIGLFVNEEIITADQDESLYDNSRGFSNYSAPGADRLKISTTLIKKPIDDFDDQNFIELLRIDDGSPQKFVTKTQYSVIAEELARRTYDESGDYYITPFTIIPKNSLNDRLGNNGLFFENELTPNGNKASDDLMVYKISPGKAYVRGFEVVKDGQTLIDIDKPRTTNSISNEGVAFKAGGSVYVNNVYGQPKVGLGTTAYLSLRDSRIGNTRSTSAGEEIGVARAYDFRNINATGITTNWELSFFDVETFTKIGLSTNITLSTPILIEGTSSGAKGYLRSNVSGADQLTLCDVNGKFVKNEGIVVNGIGTFGHIIRSVNDYTLGNVYSVYQSDGSSTFNADLLLDVDVSPNINIKTSAAKVPIPSYTISAKDATGISTLTSSDVNFIGIVTVGNVVSYNRTSVAGFTTVTFNKVSSISSSGRLVQLSPVTTVNGICNGETPDANITINDLTIKTSKRYNVSDSTYTVKLTQKNIKSVDSKNSEITLKRQYNIASFSGNNITGPDLSNTDYIYTGYESDGYCLSYSDGTIEPLVSSQFSFLSGMKQLEIKNLSKASGSNATLIITIKKSNLTPKIKKLNRVNSLIISRSNRKESGTGSSTLNDGLTYSEVYGTRVQDEEISLNVPDVVKVLSIFESDDTNDPTLPTMSFTLGSLSGLNKITTDLLIGEKFVGQSSGAVGIVVSIPTNSIVEFVYLNTSQFSSGETVEFVDSKITGICDVLTLSDKNITTRYELDDGYKNNYYDYSRLIKKDDRFSPTRKIKVIFQNYYIESSDTGDIVTVDSYPVEEYGNLPFINADRASDRLDIRPRVSPYDMNSNYSPFEFASRNFSGQGQSNQYYIAPDKSFFVSFSYYLPRIDKIFLSKEGNIQVVKGIPSINPLPPKSVDDMLEIATVNIPAYLYKIDDAVISLATHKRYRMQDISRLEGRIKNLEYYTQLSLLEVAADTLTVKTNGLDRFKSGFFVDNFKSHVAHDDKNPIFKASIDKGKGYLRPSYNIANLDLIGQSAAIGVSGTKDSSVDYKYEESGQDENYKKHENNIITLKYTHKELLKNEFATRVENVTPFLVTSYTGILELSPSSDTWFDSEKLATNKVTVEGSYQSTIKQLDVNPKTGFSPIQYGVWQTDWIGVDVRSNVSKNASQTINSEKGSPNPNKKGTVTDKLQVELTMKQSREDVVWEVSEDIDSVNLGSRIVNTETLKYMRERNVEFVAKKLKPNTRFYPFFDNVKVASYCLPKLIEILMINVSGNRPFKVGETVRCENNSGKIIGRFRVAESNHKYGPYNAPTETYTTNPYSETGERLQGAYSLSSTVLNIDTASLAESSNGEFFGQIRDNCELIGEDSLASAVVTKVALISDEVGTLIGSFYVPNNNERKFETGIRQFRLSDSKDDNAISGGVSSFAQDDFFAQGFLQNSQDTVLGVRNAKVRKETYNTTREKSSVDSALISDSSFVNSLTKIVETGTLPKKESCYADPLAQSFAISEPNGVFVTKVDLYFYKKDTNVYAINGQEIKKPVIVQIRTVENGVPTSTVLSKDAEVIINPSQIDPSEDASKATEVSFKSPVYLENEKEYALVLLSDSTEYQVWISRMGEEDVSTRDLPESAKRIVSQQPTLGSLFKSQNGSTWEPSGYEDLKFTLYRAVFSKDPATFSFYNPIPGKAEEDSERKLNDTRISLSPSSLNSLSNKFTLGLSTYISATPLSFGVSIGVTDTNLSGKLVGLAGSVSISPVGLTTINVGSGYSNTSINNVPLETVTGDGEGLTANLTFSSNGLGISTVVNGGFGYRVGDIVSVASTIINSTQAQLSVNSLGSVNTLFLDNVQGNTSSSLLGKLATFVTSSGITSAIGVATVSYRKQNATNDGLHFKITNPSHGMYSTNNLVLIRGVKSNIKPVILSATYSSNATTPIEVSSVGIFTTFENVSVSSTNPGYVKIEKEVIKYTGVNDSNNTLTGITRGIDSGSFKELQATQHEKDDYVYKYEFNGVSLRRINRVHNMSSPLATVPTPINHDNYYIKIDMIDTDYGINRSGNSDFYFPDLYFNETKNGSSPNYNIEGLDTFTASQNIVFSSITPNVNIFTPKGTGISSRIRTISATSVDGSEISFQDEGFESVTLNDINDLTTLRMVASPENEDAQLTDLPGNKSLTLVIDMFTGDDRVSPVIDAERVSMILTSNKIDAPVDNWTANTERLRSTRSPINDIHSAVYVSNDVKLANPAISLKVLFSAYRPETSDIKVLYRIFRDDSTATSPSYEPFPGYENLDTNGQIIDSSKNTASSDVKINPNNKDNQFSEYEYSIDNLAPFSKFSIKIIMTGTDQANVPLIKELRAIALA